MCPHRRQPTRLPRPWDSPGKNTGVGCHFLFQWMKVKSESEVAQSCPTLSDSMHCSLPGSSVHGIFQARVLEWGAIYVVGNQKIVWPTFLLWPGTDCTVTPRLCLNHAFVSNCAPSFLLEQKVDRQSIRGDAMFRWFNTVVANTSPFCGAWSVLS